MDHGKNIDNGNGNVEKTHGFSLKMIHDMTTMLTITKTTVGKITGNNNDINNFTRNRFL